MATNVFSLRCKTQNGVFTLNELTSDCTVEKLKLCLEKHTQKKPQTMRILCGYPPKALNVDSDSLKLSEVNIHSGDTVIMETIAESPKPAVVQEVNESMFADQSGIMLRHVVPSNNSCLFASMYFLLIEPVIDEERSNELRNIIVSAVEKNPTKYNEAYLGMPNPDYCRWILDKNHWGGAIELAILSEHFGVEIVAVDTVSLKLHQFGETKNFNNRVFLIYDGIHYDPLLMELENERQTVFPTSDSKPLEMAMEIAKEAKSSRQFTDVANFTVCCQVCHVKLQGDKEARQHAKETGHCEYGEL